MSLFSFSVLSGIVFWTYIIGCLFILLIAFFFVSYRYISFSAHADGAEAQAFIAELKPTYVVYCTSPLYSTVVVGIHVVVVF